MGIEKIKLLADAFEMARSTYTSGIKVHNQPFSEDLIELQWFRFSFITSNR